MNFNTWFFYSFYTYSIAFFLTRLKFFYISLRMFQKTYSQDIYAYNEICRDIQKKNDLGKNAAFCEDVEIRITTPPWVQSLQEVYDNTYLCGDSPCSIYISFILNDWKVLVLLIVVLLILLLLSKIILFFKNNHVNTPIRERPYMYRNETRYVLPSNQFYLNDNYSVKKLY